MPQTSQTSFSNSPVFKALWTARCASYFAGFARRQSACRVSLSIMMLARSCCFEHILSKAMPAAVYAGREALAVDNFHLRLFETLAVLFVVVVNCSLVHQIAGHERDVTRDRAYLCGSPRLIFERYPGPEQPRDDHCDFGLENRTPTPPPFSGINSIPAFSKATWIASTVEARSCSPRSNLAIVSGDTRANLAKSRVPHPSATRAILH